MSAKDDVTQADRDAAADYLDIPGIGICWAGHGDEVRAGSLEIPLVHAFAAHRRAAASPCDDLAGALEIIAGGSVDISDTAIIVGNGASTVMRQVRTALNTYRGKSDG
jgi:hypothetical protein